MKFMTSPKTFQEAEFVYDRATKLEFAAEYQPAFNLYLEAAEAFIHLSRSATGSPLFQAQCKENASKALQRAQKIEKASKTPGAKIGPVAASVNPFGASPQLDVLRRSSTVNDIRYPLWSEPVSSPSNSGTCYSDPNGQPTLPPSIVSNQSVVTWKRVTLDLSQVLSSNLTPNDIEQNIINDCSVCASVSICLQHNLRFNSNAFVALPHRHLPLLFNLPAPVLTFLSREPFLKLLSSSLFPGNQPGRYDLKAYLNGDYRRISIDDLLPFDDMGRPIGISTGQKPVVWPALIEKAYMKLMGGYDFPGSNSSIDLRVLTGWIPEHVELQSTSFEREKTWKRIAHGFWKGYCVLTVGTDAKTLMRIQGVKLLPSHDYAVVSIREAKNERWVTLIDSRVPATSPSLYKNDSNLGKSRMLDMRWEDICATFEGMYVSWNPDRFPNNTNFHGVWKPPNAKDKTQASVRHLRLLYECHSFPGGGDGLLDDGRDIWVLLTRHLSQTRRESEYITLAVQHEDEDDRRDIWVKNENTEVKSPYTTSPHVLVRTRVGEHPTLPHATSSDSSASPAISGAFMILLSYDGPFDDVFFTVNVFCGTDIKVRWDENAGIGDPTSTRESGFSTKVDGTLTIKNAGGNHTHPTYMLNPQWHLRIYDDNGSLSGLSSNRKSSPPRGSVASSGMAGGKHKAVQKSVVVLSVHGPREVPLNVTTVWSSGERIVELTQKEVAISSGAYTYGRARAAADIPPGDYTVILSAFEPQTHLGQFTLKVESSLRFDLRAIPAEGAGLYTRVSKGEWGEHTAVGGPSHGRYHLNPIYEVQLSSSAQFGARLHLTSPASNAALNLSLFSASTPATPILDRPLASSGPYSDGLSGVCIPIRTLRPGKYWLIPSTFTAGVSASFRLVIYCSDSGCVVSRRQS